MASNADEASFAKALLWVKKMREAYTDIVAREDRGFAGDEKWPPCPPEVQALANRF